MWCEIGPSFVLRSSTARTLQLFQTQSVFVRCKDLGYHGIGLIDAPLPKKQCFWGFQVATRMIMYGKTFQIKSGFDKSHGKNGLIEVILEKYRVLVWI